MAAITPHIGGEEPMDPTVAQYHDCATGKGRLTGLGAVYGCPAPGEAMAVQHAGLSRLEYGRALVAEALSGRTIELQKVKGVYRLVLDEPLPGDVVPWSLMSSPSYGSAALLTWTSKMQTPSFSLPAGAPQMGGSCPGAQAGQSVVPEGPRRKQERRVLQVLNNYAGRGQEPIRSVDLPGAVCNHCYATGGNYAYTDMALDGMIRFAWTQWAVREGVFAPALIAALAEADYRDQEQPEHWAATGWRFVRIHDSGDFYSRAYLEAWKAVTDAFAPGNPNGFRQVMFWAPTRMWAVDGWIQIVNEVNGGAANRGNFVIRPSAYELNQHAPELREPGSGWGPASTVATPAVAERIAACDPNIEPMYDWDCRAYAEDDSKTCRGAESPLGVTGCRACWLSDGVVNYRAH